MKLINTIDGLDYELGEEFAGASGFYVSKAMRSRGLFKAELLVENRETGEEFWMPLVVRYLHPDYFLQKVAFIPT